MFIIPEKEALKVKQEDTYDTYMFLQIYSIVEKTGNKASAEIYSSQFGCNIGALFSMIA